MAVVFAAMGLILGSMALLTRLVRDPRVIQSASRGDEGATSAPDLPPRPYDQEQLRAAAIAVGLARARQSQEAVEINNEPLLTPWGDYHRHRHLHPSGRGRIA
jgi:hypothetical protein